jgi:uncharacterized protein YcfJ
MLSDLIPAMKTFLTLSLALAALVPAQAQIRPEAVNGAVIGAAAGSIIGHNSGSLGHNAWRGAAYGAGAGLLIGSFAGEANYRTNAHRPPAYSSSYYGRPRGYGYGYYSGGYGYYSRPYVYRTEPVYYDNSDYYVTSRPNYASNGLFLGALAGAIIGNNSGSLGHNAWRGAAYGAGAGLLIGAIAENSARRSEASTPVVTYTQPAPAVTTQQSAPVGQQATTIINNNYYNSAPASPMSSANSMFGRN